VLNLELLGIRGPLELSIALEPEFTINIGLPLMFIVKLIFTLNRKFMVKSGSMQWIVLVLVLAIVFLEFTLLAKSIRLANVLASTPLESIMILLGLQLILEFSICK